MRVSPAAAHPSSPEERHSHMVSFMLQLIHLHCSGALQYGVLGQVRGKRTPGHEALHWIGRAAKDAVFTCMTHGCAMLQEMQ